ncbi:MAG: hypothetical protein ABSC06_02860 [Rhodopila sp.]|jgi:hypothetical protein
MIVARSSTPPIVLTYGLLGVMPFLLPAAAGVAFPAFKEMAGMTLALYGG